MTDQEINEAIALHLGWTKETKEIDYQDGYQWTEIVTHWRMPGGTRFSYCEDYCNDLNAMHEAENTLSFKTKIDEYYIHLCSTSGAMPCYATAHQRAEAFLRTIGKWRNV